MPPDFDEADIWADVTDPHAISPAAKLIACLVAAAVIVGVAGAAKMAGWL